MDKRSSIFQKYTGSHKAYKKYIYACFQLKPKDRGPYSFLDDRKINDRFFLERASLIRVPSQMSTPIRNIYIYIKWTLPANESPFYSWHFPSLQKRLWKFNYSVTIQLKTRIDWTLPFAFQALSIKPFVTKVDGEYTTTMPYIFFL